MSERELVLYGHPALRKKAETVDEITDEIRELVEDMTRVMYEERGIGLAANQVGMPLRVMVVDIPGESEGETVSLALINPRFTSTRGSTSEEEGCLSIPGIREKVKRFAAVTLSATTLEGETIEIEADDLLGRAFQHEIDHLDGILFVDRLSSMKRALLKRQLADIAAGKVPKESEKQEAG